VLKEKGFDFTQNEFKWRVVYRHGTMQDELESTGWNVFTRAAIMVEIDKIGRL
jgi:hypothetical protein